MQVSLPPIQGPRTEFAAARAALARGDRAEAAAIFRRAAAHFADRKNVISDAADGLRDCGLWTEAVVLLENAVQQWPVSAALLGRLSRAYLDAKDYARAAACLRKFLAHDSDPDIWNHLGEVYLAAGEFEQSVDAFNQVLAAEPLNLEAIVSRGDAFLELDRPDQALADFRRAEAIAPKNPEVLGKYGALLLHMGSLTEAATTLQRAAQVDGQNQLILGNLCMALSAIGRFEDAERVAGTMDPGFGFGRFALGTAQLGLENFAAAAENLKLAADLMPNDIDVLTALANAETAQENVFGAERALQQVLALEPENAVARFAIAALHGEAVDAAPPNFARDAFDVLAMRYDLQFGGKVTALATAAATLLEDEFPEREGFARVLDLGCGTGLAAAALHDAFRLDAVTGIDISPRMIHVAAQKGLYGQLVAGDALHVGRSLNETFDLVTAIDLAPYLGNLSALFQAARETLAADGLFLCSIEISDERAYQLTKRQRFAHRLPYVEDTARNEGFALVAQRTVAIPQEAGRTAPGALLLFKRA